MAISRSQFRPHSSQESLRSDRSAGDRARHRYKVRQAIRDNIADIVAEEAIIGQSGDKIVKVPIQGIKEYRFVFGDNKDGVGSGNGGTQPGDKVGKANGGGQGAEGGGGNAAGVDYYETEITLDELISILFEDLELPELERRKLRKIPAERTFQRKGFTRAGVRSRLDKKRTVISRVRRRIAAAPTLQERFPFHQDDLIYKRLRQDERPQSNAVVICMMDTSASMTTTKKYLARSFFFLLYQFVRIRYQHVEVVFIAHHTSANEVSEEQFFHKGESGGTCLSSAYNKALEVINDRYHPSLWNIYAFHCSDGDNFSEDNAAAISSLTELCGVSNLVGYGEIKPAQFHFYESSMMHRFKQVQDECFHSVLIRGKEDLWPSFQELLKKDRVKEQSI